MTRGARAGPDRLRWTYLSVTERRAAGESEILHVEGVSIRIATPRMLHRMKRNTVRPQDGADAQLLKQGFGLEDD